MEHLYRKSSPKDRENKYGSKYLELEWKKKGLIFVTTGDSSWNISHAQVPRPLFVEEGKLRIYYGTRDRLNRTYTSFIDVNPEEPSEILYIHSEPVMNLGLKGKFDEHGVMPSCFVKQNENILMYYTGWSYCNTHPYCVYIGIAKSRDNGVTFERMSTEPIIGKENESVSCSQPFIFRDINRWKMWYSSFTKWVKHNDKEEPFYNIKYSESEDGINWKMPAEKSLDYDEYADAYSSPYVWNEDGLWKMVYSYRKGFDYREKSENSYRIGYAVSKDGRKWEKNSNFLGLEISDNGWDSEMVGYPSIYFFNDKKYLLYNGNGFGKTGFGYAISKSLK